MQGINTAGHISMHITDPYLHLRWIISCLSMHYNSLKKYCSSSPVTLVYSGRRVCSFTQRCRCMQYVWWICWVVSSRGGAGRRTPDPLEGYWYWLLKGGSLLCIKLLPEGGVPLPGYVETMIDLLTGLFRTGIHVLLHICLLLKVSWEDWSCDSESCARTFYW